MTDSSETRGKGAQKQHFDLAFGGDAAENYQKYFVTLIGRPVAAQLVEIADIKPAERVLDVAAGTGAATFLAKEKTGQQGKVTGIDLNPGMLQTARSLTPPDINIEWHHASADNLPLDDESVDVVICNVSLQFFPDKVKALKEMRRVLVEGGRLTFILPAPEPVFGAAQEVFARRLGSEAAGFVRAVFSLHDFEQIEGMLKEAGFRNIRVRMEKKPLNLPLPAEFLWQYIASTPVSAALTKLDDHAYAELENEMVEKWQRFVKGNSLIFEHHSIIGTAIK